jgi:hypothetical protein
VKIVRGGLGAFPRRVETERSSDELEYCIHCWNTKYFATYREELSRFHVAQTKTIAPSPDDKDERDAATDLSISMGKVIKHWLRVLLRDEKPLARLEERMREMQRIQAEIQEAIRRGIRQDRDGISM